MCVCVCVCVWERGWIKSIEIQAAFTKAEINNESNVHLTLNTHIPVSFVLVEAFLKLHFFFIWCSAVLLYFF